MKFVIHVPPWNETSGGDNILWNLGRILFEKGYDVKMWVEKMSDHESNVIFRRYTNEIGYGDDTVVIYPEMILHNPLQATNIVRFVLYGAHLYDYYQPNEKIYYLAPFCKNNKDFKCLQGWYVSSKIENRNLPRTNESCYMLKKGGRSPIMRKRFEQNPPPGLNIEALGKHTDIIEVFNTTKYFHCYDPVCFLTIMATLCGCITIQHPYDDYTREEWEYASSFGAVGKLKGVAYGIEELPYAEATLHEAPEQFKEFMKNSDRTIDRFIEDMESGATTKPCYKFNDSPYAFQHVWR